MPWIPQWMPCPTAKEMLVSQNQPRPYWASHLGLLAISALDTRKIQNPSIYASTVGYPKKCLHRLPLSCQTGRHPGFSVERCWKLISGVRLQGEWLIFALSLISQPVLLPHVPSWECSEWFFPKEQHFTSQVAISSKGSMWICPCSHHIGPLSAWTPSTLWVWPSLCASWRWSK